MSTSPQQYCSISINLTRKFLKWIHSHRLIDGEYGSIWDEAKEDVSYQFGGRHGSQFKTVEEVLNFRDAFSSMLERKGVDTKHTYPLWYIIGFLYQDHQDQSIENNRHNHLQDYAQFLLDLISDSNSHFEKMQKNTSYKPVQDAMTNEIFFVKKEIVASMPYDELIEYLPQGKEASEIVRYMRISFLDEELYVPDDIIISVCSNSKRKLKSLSGVSMNHFQLPSNLQYQVFTFIVTEMLEQLRKHNTEFYQQITSRNVSLRDFATQNVKYKKNHISNTQSLQRIGLVISDYLLQNNIMKTKRSIAHFVFEYFALFKAFQLKKPVPMPNNYDDIIQFYIKKGINHEYMRHMMKELGKFSLV